MNRAIFYVLFLAVGFFAIGAEGARYHVNADIGLVQWEGWGTSMAWWPDVLGAMPQDVIDTVNTAFFAPNNLNLNIVRYAIGGTTPGDYKCGGYRDGGATESFLDGPGQEYNWERDPRQRAILLAAKEMGVDTFEAFSNSPPQWMTISGCSKGNDDNAPLHENFDAVNASLFADYATEVIRHYHDNLGITFQYYAPFNEPSGLNGNGYWQGSTGNQEGCSMSLPVMGEILQAMSTAINDKGMDYVSLSIADETQINQAITSQNYFYDEGLSSLAGKLNVHGYSDAGDNRRDLLRMQANRDRHRLWMDEMGWSSLPLGEMDQGLNLANRIVTDLRLMLPSAWVYWQAMEDDGGWGLVSLPYTDPSVENIKYHSGYYAMMQFSKYIKKGSSIIYVSDENAVAALDPSTNSLVIVVVNPNDTPSDEHMYDLGLFTTATEVTATRTSLTEQNSNIDPPIYNATGKYFLYSAPARSITTFVIPFVSSTAQLQTYFRNGDFEQNGADYWGLVGSYVDSSYVFSGEHNAVLDPTEQSYVGQRFNIPDSEDKSMKHYYVSAWFKSGEGVNNVLVAMYPLEGGGPIFDSIFFYSDAGYKMVSHQFDAKAGDRVVIYFYSQIAKYKAYLDDVRLYRSF